ncbi:hypothetical protein FQN54_003515 [Arachnomyces sp. PD_36]|nr:hypothetical protein FQN54_003515 [Arachnomyces sp. PD_36]
MEEQKQKPASDVSSDKPPVPGETQSPPPAETNHPTTSPPPTTDAKEKPRLLWSEKIGRPPYVLDPDDLPRDGMRRLDDTTIVKYGTQIQLAEAEAMHLVSTQTSIPTPKIEAAYVLDGRGFIVMSYEEGRGFAEYWEDASEDEREGLIAQLKDYVSQMRKIKGPFIGGVDGSACRDAVFAWDWKPDSHEYGPYKDQEELNEGLVRACRYCHPPNPDREKSSWWMTYQLARSFKSKEIVFTHGDLHPGNMVVRDDGTVVLLDWGLSGYFPDYWEFYRATFNGAFREDFHPQIERFVPPFYMEACALRQIFERILG